jgi:hypothetical protein
MTSEVQCANCGHRFVSKKTNPLRDYRFRFCSKRCKGDFQAKHPASVTRSFIDSNHPIPERHSASALISKRVKRGHIARPSHCENCQRSCKPDGHHPDYWKRNLIVWLCHSCHIKAHHSERLAAHVASLAKRYPLRRECEAL